jgi:dihydrofolate synthase / folylpolyglutamate synthase
VDAAHVPASVRLLLDELGGLAGLDGRPVVLLALGRDKDAPGVLKALGERADTVLCTSPTGGPLRPAEELAGLARSAAGLDAVAIESPAAALERALELARGRWLLVIGSFYLAGAVRAALPPPPDAGPSERPC